MRYRSLLALLPLALTTPVRAQTDQARADQPQIELNCPASLTVTSTPTAIPGWQAMNIAAAALPLERIAIRPTPDSPVDLPHSSFLRLEQGERRTIQANWDLQEARRAHRDLWLICVYTGTSVALSRPLPAAINACEFRIESTGDNLRESAICR